MLRKLEEQMKFQQNFHVQNQCRNLIVYTRKKQRLNLKLVIFKVGTKTVRYLKTNLTKDVQSFYVE